MAGCYNRELCIVYRYVLACSCEPCEPINQHA